jgi:hypothetical protein
VAERSVLKPAKILRGKNVEQYNVKMRELLSALANVCKKQQEYHQAIALAREKSEELSTLTKLITKQPHIQIDDYEIDN